MKVNCLNCPTQGHPLYSKHQFQYAGKYLKNNDVNLYCLLNFVILSANCEISEFYTGLKPFLLVSSPNNLDCYSNKYTSLLNYCLTYIEGWTQDCLKWYEKKREIKLYPIL